MKTFEKILLVAAIISFLIAAIYYCSVQIGWAIDDTPVKYSDRLKLFFSWPIWFFVPGVIILLYFQIKNKF